MADAAALDVMGPRRSARQHGRFGGLDDHPVHGKKGHGPVPVDTTVEQVAEGEFDALVIPGGFAPDKLRRSQAVLDLVRAFDGAGKPIAFICHAGWVPISARILAGRRATSVGAIGKLILSSVNRRAALSVASRRWKRRCGFSIAALTVCQP